MDVQHPAAPEAGKDYPRTWSEFLDWFSREDACLRYLERQRLAGAPLGAASKRAKEQLSAGEADAN